MQQQQQQQTPRHTQSRPASGRRQSQQQQQQLVTPLQAVDQPQQQQQQGTLQQHDTQAAAPSDRSIEAMQPEDVYMDSIIHKLQLLNYEREFCRRKKPYRKGLTPYYFAAAQTGVSGNEQFYYFTSLAVWLLRLCSITLPSPKEFDDPNTTLQGILQGLRAVGFAAPSYPPTKLLPGWGREVCALLDCLLDATLERRGLSRLPRTVFSEDGPDAGEAVVDEDVTQDDEAADITSQAAAAMLLAAQDSSGDDVPLAGLLHNGGGAAGDARGGQQAAGAAAATAAAAAEASPAKQVLVSTVDPVAWKLEVERVAPKLRVAAAASTGTRDWRQHLETAHAHMRTLSAAWPDVRSQLEQLSGDASASLEKLEGREKQLTNQFQELLGTYRESRQQLTDLQEEFSRRTELISERNNELHRVAAALEDVKQQLESRGSNLTDASPLVRLKAAMSSLREELKGMELRIGVVAHNLMTLSLRDKQAALQDAAKRARDVTSAKAGVSPARRET